MAKMAVSVTSPKDTPGQGTVLTFFAGTLFYRNAAQDVKLVYASFRPFLEFINVFQEKRKP